MRTVRNWRGLSQGQLGEEIGVTYQQVQKYENGKSPITLTRWLRACAALDVTPDRMIGFIEKPAIPR